MWQEHSLTDRTREQTYIITCHRSQFSKWVGQYPVLGRDVEVVPRARALSSAFVLFVCLFCLVLGVQASAKEITLLVHWGEGNEQFAVLTEATREYQALNPAIRISILGTVGNTYDMWAKYLVMSAAGVPPSAIHVHSLFPSEFRPLPADLVNQMKRAYIPQALTIAELNGEYLGFPTEFQSPAVVYNTALMAEAGLGGAPTPATWDDFWGIARKLTRYQLDGQVEVAGFVGGGSREVHDIRSYLNSNGHDVVTPDGRALLNSPPMIEAVSIWKDLVDSGVMSRAKAKAFAQQKGVMAIWEPYLRKNLVSVNKEAYFDGVWRATQQPHGSLGQPHVRTYGYVWAIPKGVSNPDVTLEFLAWLNMSITERGTTRMGDVLASLGSLPHTFSDMRNQPLARESFVKDYIEILPRHVHVSPPAVAGYDTWATIFQPRLVEIFQGSTTLIQGLEQAQVEYQRELDQAAAVR